MRRANFSVTHFMTALPAFDFAMDAGTDYFRDSATSNTRAKTRPDETQGRDWPAADDVREDRSSDFDKALREQNPEEPARPRVDRIKEREAPASEPVRADRPAAEKKAGPEEVKTQPKQTNPKARPEAEQPAAQTAAAQTAVPPSAVQVVSALGPKLEAATPDAAGEASAESKSAASDGQDAGACAVNDMVIAPNAAAQTQVQGMLAALNAGAPAPQQTQQNAAEPAEGEKTAPAADPLALSKGVKPGVAAEAALQPAAPVQTGESDKSAAPAESQAAAAPKPATAAPPKAAVEAAAIATPPPEAKAEAKLRQPSDANALKTDAPAQPAAVNNAAQPVAALQNALKAAAAQGAKDVQAPDAQGSDAKATTNAQHSSFAAHLDAPTTQSASQSSGAAQTHAATNTNAIAHNVVRFFRETGTGNARFDIRLDPVELGRVDARVEINHDKTVTLTLTAERPETLAELMRTARDLERQLSDSGVKLSDDGLKFRLNSDARGDAQQNMQGGADGQRPARGAYAAGAKSVEQAETAIPIRSWRASGVDVWA